MAALVVVAAAAGGAGIAELRIRAAKPRITPPTRLATPAEVAEAKKARLTQSEIFATLDRSRTYEILSLEPVYLNPTSGFHGYRVLGQTFVSDSALRKRVNDAVVAAAKERAGLVSGCMFNPRHGLRVVSAGDTLELVICFECGDVQAFHNGYLIQMFPIANGPEPIMDQILTAAGVRLAEKAK